MSEAAIRTRAAKRHWAEPGSRHDMVVRWTKIGLPLLIGVSRKSMIGQVLGRPVDERLYGSLALAALAVTRGAQVIRVHDVAETVDVVRMIAAVEWPVPA